MQKLDFQESTLRFQISLTGSIKTRGIHVTVAIKLTLANVQVKKRENKMIFFIVFTFQKSGEKCLEI